MTRAGRKTAVGLGILALVLAAGRWGTTFLADRRWEASVSDLVAQAGASRALFGAALELGVTALAVGWLLLHFLAAARIALPIRPPARTAAGGEPARAWPAAIPRWSLAAIAGLLGILLGDGAALLLDPLRLALDGARLGVRESLTGADLGTFLGRFPFWSGVEALATRLSLVALAGSVLLHAAGGTLRVAGRRLRASPRARPQLALLLFVSGLCLAWDASLEPLRLVAGVRGPVPPAEFALQSLLAYLATGLGIVAAVLSLLWWAKLRGQVGLVFWMMFLLVRLGGPLLPLHGGAASSGPEWRAAARDLDSIAYQLSGLERGPAPDPAPVALLVPTLWDDSMAALVLETRLGLQRVSGLFPPGPAWVGVRRAAGGQGEIVALSDDQVTPTGGPLGWDPATDRLVPGVQTYRVLPGAALAISPGAPRVAFGAGAGAGVVLDGWLDRLVFAWAWQAPAALRAGSGARAGWRLDPADRLLAAAPFAHWSVPRLGVVGTRPVWLSDGLLVAEHFPSSTRVPWGLGGDRKSMVRSAFLATVDAGTGTVRIFRRDRADSMAAAWARISGLLIEVPESLPAGLREGDAYPLELALAQARALAGPAWGVGNLPPSQGGAVLPAESAGGRERLVPFLRPGGRSLSALLLIRRTRAGDSLRLLRFDPETRPGQMIESAASLVSRWERFPFQQMLRDSLLAAGALFHAGSVRYALAQEGIVAYQPAWSEALGGGRPRLALVNVALGDRLGTGRNLADAWRNLRGEISPAPVGPGAQAVLDEVRRWWLHADSALKRGDLAELGRALSYLRELLERR